MSDRKIPKTRSDAEMEISQGLIRFEKESMGRGPLETKTYLLDDLVIVRLKGVLTPTEKQLAIAENGRSRYLLKQVRNELLIQHRAMLEVLISDIVGVPVQSVHTDISTKTGERIIVFTLKCRPDFSGTTTERLTRDGRGIDVGADRVAAT